MIAKNNKAGCAVYCPKCKTMTAQKLIGAWNGGKFKCLECGNEKPAKVVN